MKSQVSSLFTDPAQMEPLLPSEHKLGPLLEQAGDLIRAADRLSGMCPPGALAGLRTLLRGMNSYYSNRIEGQHTLPLEIEQALRHDYSSDLDKARRQRLALAHMATETQLEQRVAKWTAQDIWSAQMVCDIHQDLFARLPATDLNNATSDPIVPGVLRKTEVSVGRHNAPSADRLDTFLKRWATFYQQVRRGEMQVLAAAASHHRLTWIHPFSDGNGRAARLHTHLVLSHMGLSNGLWTPLRGFARTQELYYAKLANADAPRAGDLDGRGNLSERALLEWIAYVVAQCTDQVSFMTDLLDLGQMKTRIAACLSFEAHVMKAGVREESLRALHYLFATQADLERADFKAMLGLGDRLATSQISALLARGLVETDTPYGRLRFGVPQHALRFYFPKLWPEAEAGP